MLLHKFIYMVVILSETTNIPCRPCPRCPRRTRYPPPTPSPPPPTTHPPSPKAPNRKDSPLFPFLDDVYVADGPLLAPLVGICLRIIFHRLVSPHSDRVVRVRVRERERIVGFIVKL